MADTNNSWVESYLEALLTYGLSTEYTNKPSQEGKAEKVDADRDLFAKYYVNQIMSMDESGIKDAWHKATSTRHYTEQDARLEYLAWRTWGMKQKKLLVSNEAKRIAEHDPLSEDMIHEHDETSGDDDVLTPTATTESRLKSVQEGSEQAAEPEPQEAAAADDGQQQAATAQDFPEAAQRAASRQPSRKSLDWKRQESLLIGSVAPINAEDYGSGDLDKHFNRMSSLRIDTGKGPTMANRALEALGIADDDILQDAEEDGKEDLFEGRVEGLYIVLISLHGLVRGQHMELGKDADTGGQVKYVVELARAISLHPAVHRVELLTRLIADPKVDKSYSQPEECLLAGDGELGGAYIVRLPCGDSHDYLRKEKLWPHTREFADRAIAHASNMLKRLQEVGEPCSLYTVHGHYADAGEVAALVASTMASTEECDMVMTGHSLGRNKLEHLLSSGTMSKAEIEDSYKISRRIEGEERALDYATMVFTSTQQEVVEQWGLYDGYDPKLEKVLRRRRTGRHMPIMNVIPPGLDFSNLKVDLPEDPNLKDFTGSKPAFASKSNTPRKSDSPRTSTGSRGKGGEDVSMEAAKEDAADAGLVPDAKDGKPEGGSPLMRTSEGAGGSGSFSARRSPLGGKGLVHSDSTVQMQFHMAERMEENPRIWQDISRFLRHPRKPAILAMSRPDAKKNITTLVKAFGQNPMLRELSNLVLVMGNRDNIESMAQGSQKVLGQVLKLIDLYDLYGSVAYPKAHSQNDISDIYRFPLVTKGIFVNPALQEPFGLTVIEAAAHGVPTVATKNGGPVDIMKTLHHGVTVDPTNERELGNALLDILTHPATWQEMSRNGVKNIHAYSWLAHSRKYLESVERERRHSHAAKHKTARASGTWDHRSLGVGRRSSLGEHHVGLPGQGQQQGQQDGNGAEASHNAEEKLNAGDDVRGESRSAFAVVVLDNQQRASEAAQQIKQVLAARGAAADANIGIGVVAMNSFEDATAWLKKEGVNIDEVDWVVANGGADIRHADAEGSGWSANDGWEQHIDWRWERSSLGKLLSKVSVAEMERAGSSKRLPLLASVNGGDISGVEDGGEQQEFSSGAPPRIHPHHIVMELDEKAKSALGTKGGLPPTTVVDRLRKRLRMNGYRCHLTLQMVPGKAGWVSAAPLQSCVHVTPLRASRALALRYLGHRFGVPLDRFVVLVPAPTAKGDDGDKLLVGSHCSDLQELIGGQPWILVRTPAKADASADESKLSGVDKVAIERMQVKLSKKMFGERVRWAPADDTAPLEDLLKGLPKSDGEGTQGTGQEGAHDVKEGF